MNKASARRAKDCDFKEHWTFQKEARAARFDHQWRLDDLADTDIWQQRSADPARSRRM